MAEIHEGPRQKSKIISEIIDQVDNLCKDGWDDIKNYFNRNALVDLVARIKRKGTILNLVRVKSLLLSEESRTYHLIPETEQITNVLSSFYPVGENELWSVNDMITYSEYVTLEFCCYQMNWHVFQKSKLELPQLVAIDETYPDVEKYNYSDLLSHTFTFPETLKNREKFVAYIEQNYHFCFTQDWSSLPMGKYIVVAIFSPFNIVISSSWGKTYYFLREDEIQTLLYETNLCSSEVRDLSSTPTMKKGCDILMLGDQKVIEIKVHDYTYEGQPTIDLYRLIDMDRIVK